MAKANIRFSYLEKVKSIMAYAPKLISLFILLSCGKPYRKTMPEFSFDSGNFESSSVSNSGNEPFETSETSVWFDGRESNFLLIKMPDAQNDAQAISLVNSYAGMVETIVGRLSSLGENGVIINLASSQKTSRIEFSVVHEKGQKFDFSIVLLFDDNSALRATNFIAVASQLREFRLIRIDQPSIRYGSHECFRF